MSLMAVPQCGHQLTMRSPRYIRPFSQSLTKTSRTAREQPSSMVKRSRDQSQLAPMRRSWEVMRPPNSSFHAQARRRKPSRPRLSLVRPSCAIFSTTFTSVAMDAWSVPGSHRVGSPRMRW